MGKESVLIVGRETSLPASSRQKPKKKGKRGFARVRSSKTSPEEGKADSGVGATEESERKKGKRIGRGCGINSCSPAIGK